MGETPEIVRNGMDEAAVTNSQAMARALIGIWEELRFIRRKKFGVRDR